MLQQKSGNHWWLCLHLLAMGNPSWFDGEAEVSAIIPKDCLQLPEIRRLVKEAQGRIPMHLEKGVYNLHTWVPPASPFVGQGW